LYAIFLNDRVDEVDHKDFDFESYTNKRRKYSELVESVKSLNSPTLSSDGPFVRNNEMANNKIVQNLCIIGKLTAAARMIDVTYTLLIDLVCKHCGATRALEVFEDIAREGCYPSILICGGRRVNSQPSDLSGDILTFK
jgi:pentatricopeptide repeat protein